MIYLQKEQVCCFVVICSWKLVDGSETWSDLLSVSLIGRCSPQVLSALFDFQFLADLSADPFALLVQKLLHAGVGEIRVLVQTKLLQNRQPTRVALNGHVGNNNGIVRAGKAGQMDKFWKRRNNVQQSENKFSNYSNNNKKGQVLGYCRSFDTLCMQSTRPNELGH